MYYLLFINLSPCQFALTGSILQVNIFYLALSGYTNLSHNFTNLNFGCVSLLRWLDWIFLGGYLLSLSINYVAISIDMEKRFPKLYYIKTKISYDLVFFCNRSRHGNVTTPLRFLFIFVFLCTRIFFKKSLKGVCTFHNCLNYGKV